MKQLLANSWWMLALQGVAAIVFGVLAVAWPGATLLFLVTLFAAYALVSGVVALAAAFRNTREAGWWHLLVLGIVMVAAGILAIAYPGITLLVLVVFMGVNAILSGAMEISMAVRLRKEIRGEWLLGLAGAVAIVFGIVVLLAPAFGAFALVWLVAFYAIVSGVLLLSLGMRLRSQLHGGARGTARAA